MLRLALRNLIRRRVRTSLTILGVAVAIAFTVVILSISEGLIISINSSVAKQGEDILVFPREVELQVLFLGQAHGPGLSQRLVGELASQDNVNAAYPIFNRPLPIKTTSPIPMPIELQGVTPDFFPQLRPFARPSQGRLLTKEDRDAVVITPFVARAVGLKLGDRLQVRDRELEVVGILEPSTGFEELFAYAPLATVQELYGAEGELSAIALKVEDQAKAEETARKIAELFPDVSARTLREVLQGIMDILSIARAIHFSLSTIALLIGILFILSTMLMAVTERTREIGTLRALGTPRSFVFRLIMAESLLTSLVAGVIGAVGGFLLSKAITFGLAQALGQVYIQAVVSPRLYATGLAIALLVGTFAGLYPAWRISRVNIVEALRYE